MIQRPSRLHRKSIGLFVGATLVPLLGLLIAVNYQLNLSPESRQAATWAAIACWGFSVVGILIVDGLITRRLGRLAVILKYTENTRSGLARLATGQDEVSQIARLLQHALNAGAVTTMGVETDSDRLSNVINSLPNGVIAIDLDEKILFANSRARQMLGIPSTQVSGRPVYEVIRNDSVQEIIRTAIQTEETETIEIQIPRSDLRVSMLAAPLDGDPCPGIVVVLHDVSDARKQEHVRRDFIAAVSHELKTPLTVIQACTETILDGALDVKEDAIHFLKQITEQSERMHQLVTGMLRLSRVETGQKVLHPVAIDLGELAARICDEFELPASQDRVSLKCSADQPLIVHADPDAMRTIISNLVDNAVKYCDAGERVTVDCTRNENNASLKVIDTGPGIAAEHRDRVFERFYRVDRHRSREKGGTGLGLAIVKHMVQLSGGTISLSSRIGHGSTFEVLMPLAVAEVAAAPPNQRLSSQ